MRRSLLVVLASCAPVGDAHVHVRDVAAEVSGNPIVTALCTKASVIDVNVQPKGPPLRLLIKFHSYREIATNCFGQLNEPKAQMMVDEANAWAQLNVAQATSTPNMPLP